MLMAVRIWNSPPGSMEIKMVQQKLFSFNLLKLLTGRKSGFSSYPHMSAATSIPRTPEEYPFPAITDKQVLIDYYQTLGRGPLR
jgi:hypothetical protein